MHAAEARGAEWLCPAGFDRDEAMQLHNFFDGTLSETVSAAIDFVPLLTGLVLQSSVPLITHPGLFNDQCTVYQHCTIGVKHVKAGCAYLCPVC